MVADPDLLELAVGWQPQRPGRRAPKDIEDALVEPDWDGLAVVVALSVDQAVFVHDHEAITVPAELPTALVAAFRAIDALVEGCLTTMALKSGEGIMPPTPGVARPPLLIPRFVGGNRKDDPFVRAREFEKREVARAPGILAALERGERHAFVATDLLYLDGTPLHDIPLLERKRLLDGTLEASHLVRVAPIVKPSAIRTQVTWGTLGFTELHYRAANSRYMAGQENPDCAVSRPPDGLHGPATGPSAPH